MTKEEFTQELIALLRKQEIERNDIRLKYLISQTLYKPGDIIQDHQTTLLIEEVMHMVSCLYISYRGTALKKDLTPRKRQTKEVIYQQNVEHVHLQKK